MAPKWIRGTLVCAYQLAITCGILIAGVVNIFTQTIDSPNAFRIPLSIQFVWAGVLFLGLALLPETPRYLIKQNQHHAAALSLSRLRRLDITHPALIEELAEIEANHAYELSLGPSTYKDIFLGSPHLGRRLLTGCALQMLQQLTGCVRLISFLHHMFTKLIVYGTEFHFLLVSWNVYFTSLQIQMPLNLSSSHSKRRLLMYFKISGTTFFKNVGVSSPFVIQLITDIVNTVSTLPGMILVESLGRRRLLMFGAAGMALSHFLIASVGTAVPQAEERAANIVLIVFVCSFIFFFASSWGPVIWVVTSEIYPLKVRAKSMSISTASNWLLNFAIAYGVPYLINEGPGYANLQAKIFFLWASFCVIAFVFVWCMVYETSKISLEQIDELYERVDHAWNSTNFQPSWSFQEMRDEGVSASGIQLQLQDTQEEPRRRTGTSASAAGSEGTMSEEDKIIAGMGDVDLSY
jgi:hypothetical protein